MEFTVRPAALRELALLLTRAREDVDSARAHLVDMEHFAYADGALAVCPDGHRAAYRTLSDWLGKVADPTLTATAAAVAGTAAAAYAEQVNRGPEAMRDFDLSGALGALAEQDAPVEKPADKPRREPDEDDDLFTGGLLGKRRPR